MLIPTNESKKIIKIRNHSRIRNLISFITKNSEDFDKKIYENLFWMTSYLYL